MFAIIAEWDAQFRVTRYNYVKTEQEAKNIIDKLHNTLPNNKKAPNAFYVKFPVGDNTSKPYHHRARFWIADPINKTVSFDKSALSAWKAKFLV